jgi:very-short-patch-repair endonuclease
MYLGKQSTSILEADWWIYVNEEETDRLFLEINKVPCRFLSMNAAYPRKVVVYNSERRMEYPPNHLSQSGDKLLKPLERGLNKIKDHVLFKLVDIEKTIKEFEYDPSELSLGSNKKINVFCKECNNNFERDIYQFFHASQLCNLCANKQRSKNYTKTRIKNEEEKYDISIVPTIKLIQYNGTIDTFECLNCNTIFDARKNNIINSYIKFGSNCCPTCNTRGSSNLEKEVFDYVVSLGFNCLDQKQIGKYRADIYIEQLNSIIEVDGIFYHNEFHKEKTAMQERRNFLVTEGYKVFHCFEHEWRDKQDIIKSKIQAFLGLKQKKYRAESLKIKVIKPEIAKEFLDKYHIMKTGEIRNGYCFGLYDKEELICVSTFAPEKIGNLRSSDWYRAELVRYVSKGTVYGGMRRMINIFKRWSQETKILYSYADLRFTQSSNIYSVNGFQFIKQTQPNYFWQKDHNIYSRYLTQKGDKLFKFLGDKYDPSLTEIENMHNSGYARVFDCGHALYEMNFE